MEQLWWRVELDDDGKQVALEKVEYAGEDLNDVYYVQALTDAEAFRLAVNEWSRQRTEERRRRHARMGNCRCGRKNDLAPRKYCSVCVARNSRDKERSTARARGIAVPPVSKVATFAQNKSQARLDVLNEVRDAWLECGTVAQFGEWLNRAIEAAGGRRVA